MRIQELNGVPLDTAATVSSKDGKVTTTQYRSLCDTQVYFTVNAFYVQVDNLGIVG